MITTGIISKAFEQHSIRQRAADGYISATDMCKAFGKEFSNYNKSQSTRKYINALSAKTNISIVQLVEIRKGNTSQYGQGTWMHPQVATHLAMWISPKFAVEVTTWIEEWKKYSKDNHQKYIVGLNNLEPSVSLKIEAELRDRLADEFNAEKEVECESGRIDLLTYDKVIEIKHISKWKHALGQILAYACDTGRLPAVYLFDITDDMLAAPSAADIDRIKQYFLKYNVEVLHD